MSGLEIFLFSLLFILFLIVIYMFFRLEDRVANNTSKIKKIESDIYTARKLAKMRNKK